MSDRFKDYRTELDSPAESGVTLTPDDNNDLVAPTRAVYIGVSGDIKVDMLGEGTATVWTAVPVGVFPIRITRLYATDTTAANVNSMY